MIRTDRPETAISGEQAYRLTREQASAFGMTWPTWDELPWSEKDEWQARADELNEARRDVPHDTK